jgi:hypothetical protein
VFSVVAGVIQYGREEGVEAASEEGAREDEVLEADLMAALIARKS